MLVSLSVLLPLPYLLLHFFYSFFAPQTLPPALCSELTNFVFCVSLLLVEHTVRSVDDVSLIVNSCMDGRQSIGFPPSLS